MVGMFRDLLCGPALWGRLARWKKVIEPQRIPFGKEKGQYFLDFVPLAPQRETVVVYIHGGGWDKGDPAFFSFIGQRLAQEGYRCVLPGYRLVPEHRFPTQIEDVTAGTKAALDYLEGQGVDTAQVVVIGSSAGGQLGALLCYTGELAGRFSGFVGLGGAYRFDLEAPLSLKVLSKRLLAGGPAQAAQPCYLLDESSPKTPMLLIHGLEDGVVGFACGMDFYRKAWKMGIPAQLYLPETGKDNHSDYVVGAFLEERENCGTMDRLLRWLEDREPSGPDNV